MTRSPQRILTIALPAAVLGLLVLAYFVRDATDFNDPRASSFLRTPDGALAFYLLLEELGLPVERRLEPFSVPTSLPAAMAVLAPPEPVTPAELQVLEEWLAAGGVLIYAARPRDPLLNLLGLRLARARSDTTAKSSERADGHGDSAAPVAHVWTEDAAGLPAPRHAFHDSSSVLLEGVVDTLARMADGAPVALTFRRGEGRVVALSDPGPLTNRWLRESGAALILARVATQAVLDTGEPLVFDEFHQGYRIGSGPRVATLRFLRHHPLGHAALHAAAAALGLLLLAGSRFGLPLPPAPARRRSPLEHVEALAGAYRQAASRSRAMRLVLAGLARRLARRPPASEVEAEALLRHMADRPGAGRETANRMLAAWHRREGADLAAFARDADQLMKEVKGA